MFNFSHKFFRSFSERSDELFLVLIAVKLSIFSLLLKLSNLVVLLVSFVEEASNNLSFISNRKSNLILLRNK